MVFIVPVNVAGIIRGYSLYISTQDRVDKRCITTNCVLYGLLCVYSMYACAPEYIQEEEKKKTFFTDNQLVTLFKENGIGTQNSF